MCIYRRMDSERQRRTQEEIVMQKRKHLQHE